MSDEKQQSSRALVAVVSYNNGANVERTLAKIPPAAARDFDVVVIDDGSSDDTGSYIDRFDFEVIRHAGNLGVGGAIKSGIKHAIDKGYDIVCILAGNDKDDPREVPRVLEPIRRGEADYVQGSRFAAGGAHANTPLFRHVMVHVHARVFWLLTGFSGTDALNGFRAYRTSIFRDERIDIWQPWLDGYELETYLHYQVLRGGYRAVEVGVSKTYPPRTAKVKYSHIRPIIDWWRILRPIPLVALRLKR
jgi:dolichol-phosphate mannosyltransferase